jgi:hypothetical protein
MTALDAAGLALGTVGTVLGIYNTIRQVIRDRVRLSVRLRDLAQLGTARQTSAITVANTGAVAVTINSVGFLGPKGRGAWVLQNQSLNGAPAPWRLEPHSSVTIQLNLGSVRPQDEGVLTHVYAVTESGVKASSRIPGLADKIRKAREAGV